MRYSIFVLLIINEILCYNDINNIELLTRCFDIRSNNNINDNFVYFLNNDFYRLLFFYINNKYAVFICDIKIIVLNVTSIASDEILPQINVITVNYIINISNM